MKRTCTFILWYKECVLRMLTFSSNTSDDWHLSHIMTKPVLPHANNKGTDQPAHPRSLISAFFVRCLDSIIPLVSISEISSFYLAFFGCTGRFVSYLVANPEDRFSRDEAYLSVCYSSYCCG